MGLVSRLTVALALAAAPLSLALPLAAANAQALPAAVGKPLQQANNLARAGNTSGALAQVNQARAAARTPAEQRAVGQMAAFVQTRAGNYGAAAAELERIGAPASQLAPLYYQARQYDKAIAAGRRSGQMTIVGQSMLQKGDFKGAVGVYQQLAKSNPSVTNLSNLAGAQARSGDRAGYLATSERIVRLDPRPETWRRLLVDMKNTPMPAEGKLALYHLMQATGTLTNANDVQDFAKVAIVRNQPGVAAAAVQAAQKSGAIPAGDAMATRLVQAASQRQGPALAQAAAQARSPGTALQAGGAYLGAGQYPQAAAAFGVARKGPAAAEATLFQGIAQIRAGQTAAARQTFAAVPNGALKDVANLWDLYARTARPAAAAPAKAA